MKLSCWIQYIPWIIYMACIVVSRIILTHFINILKEYFMGTQTTTTKTHILWDVFWWKFKNTVLNITLYMLLNQVASHLLYWYIVYTRGFVVIS